MSHEGIRAFDNRTDEEREDSKKRYYERNASRELYEEGVIGSLCIIPEDYRQKERAIKNRARELQERDE